MRVGLLCRAKKFSQALLHLQCCCLLTLGCTDVTVLLRLLSTHGSLGRDEAAGLPTGWCSRDHDGLPLQWASSVGVGCISSSHRAVLRLVLELVLMLEVLFILMLILLLVWILKMLPQPPRRQKLLLLLLLRW